MRIDVFAARFECCESASRIVASRHLVKKSLRLASILFAPFAPIDSGSPFFTYALSMNFVLGFDGAALRRNAYDGPLERFCPLLFLAIEPSRVGVESATHELIERRSFVARSSGCANAVAALVRIGGHGKPEMKERMRASIAGAFPARRSAFYGFGNSSSGSREGPVIVLVAGTDPLRLDAMHRTNLAHGDKAHGSVTTAARLTSAAGGCRAMKEREQRGTDSPLE